MYRLRQPIKHQHKPYFIIGAIVLVAIIGFVAGRHWIKPETALVQSNPTVRQVSIEPDAVQHITKSVFSVDLPPGWEPATNPGSPYNVYSWRGTKGEDTTRRIDIYIDSLPAQLAVNRLLPAQADNDRISVIGPVSDNCASFTDKAEQSKGQASIPAKWYGVNFLCDAANYLRDVVGIGSTEGVNTLTLAGEANGSHHVLLVYTDNSSNPDYSIFISLAKSFRVD